MENTESDTSDETIRISNASIVILTPFLNRYFDTLGMLDGTSFQDVDTARRATLLLHHLTSSQHEAPEYALALCKILCGLDLETRVPESIALSDLEVKTGEMLLKSVLANWRMMSNQTVENLQGSFLIREGLLQKQDDDRWTLKVERVAYDILLDQLPWSISMIRLPWMDKHIEVSW